MSSRISSLISPEDDNVQRQRHQRYGDQNAQITDGNSSLIIAGNGNDILTAGANSIIAAGGLLRCNVAKRRMKRARLTSSLTFGCQGFG